jgi:hypothetical protein
MNKYQIGDVVKYSGNAFPNLTNRIGHVCKEELHGYVPISFPDIGITRDIFAANLELVRSKDMPVEIKDENKKRVISPVVKISKFKIGNKALVVNENSDWHNTVGIITHKTLAPKPITVCFDDTDSSGYATFTPEELELVEATNGVVIDEKFYPVEEQKQIYKTVIKDGTPNYNRTFESGATRDVSEHKFDYEAFLSPLVVNRYAQYMHKHRKQLDGTMREADDWQRGIPNMEYMKSMFRHFFDVWSSMRGFVCKDLKTGEVIELAEALCGLKFNVDGLLFNIMKEENPVMYDGEAQFTKPIKTNMEFPIDTDCCSCGE